MKKHMSDFEIGDSVLITETKVIGYGRTGQILAFISPKTIARLLPCHTVSPKLQEYEGIVSVDLDGQIFEYYFFEIERIPIQEIF